MHIDDEKEERAPRAVRVFAGVVALPIVASGIAAAIIQFPIGLVWGAMLVALGGGAARIALRGRVPTWLQRE